MSSSSNRFGNDHTTRTRSEPRDGRLDDLPSLISRSPFPTPTLQLPQAAANSVRRIPNSEPTGPESYGQFFPDHVASTLIPQNICSPDDGIDTRRVSDLSERTLYDRTEEEMQQSIKRVSLSSYQHPNDISPPRGMYFAAPPRSGARRRYGHRSSLEDSYVDGEGSIMSPTDFRDAPPRHRGVVSNLLELSRVSDSTPPWDDHGFAASRTGSLGELAEGDRRPPFARLYSLGGYDPDDPKITGATRELLDDPADLERNVKEQMDLRSMSYKQRRKEAQKIKIRFFVTCTSELPFGKFSMRAHH